MPQRLNESAGDKSARPYLRAIDIEEAMKAVIDEEPYIESADQSGLDHEVLRVPLYLLNKEIQTEYGTTNHVLWTPGVFARSFLEQETNAQTTDQLVNVRGHFEQMSWSSSRRSGISWHFVPDNTTASTKKAAPTSKAAPAPRMSKAAKRRKESKDQEEEYDNNEIGRAHV